MILVDGVSAFCDDLQVRISFELMKFVFSLRVYFVMLLNNIRTANVDFGRQVLLKVSGSGTT